MPASDEPKRDPRFAGRDSGHAHRIRALILNATLKPGPEPSSTEALGRFLAACLQEHGVDTDHVRLVDHVIAPGVESEAQGPDDEWPAIRATQQTAS